jgi:hypothetical protein
MPKPAWAGSRRTPAAVRLIPRNGGVRALQGNSRGGDRASPPPRVPPSPATFLTRSASPAAPRTRSASHAAFRTRSASHAAFLTRSPPPAALRTRAPPLPPPSTGSQIAPGCFFFAAGRLTTCRRGLTLLYVVLTAPRLQVSLPPRPPPVHARLSRPASPCLRIPVRPGLSRPDVAAAGPPGPDIPDLRARCRAPSGPAP